MQHSSEHFLFNKEDELHKPFQYDMTTVFVDITHFFLSLSMDGEVVYSQHCDLFLHIHTHSLYHPAQQVVSCKLHIDRRSLPPTIHRPPFEPTKCDPMSKEKQPKQRP